MHVCKQKRNNEEEEQKGTLLCAQHIRGDAAGQQLNGGRGETPHTLMCAHTCLIQTCADPPTHTLAITHRHTHADIN